MAFDQMTSKACTKCGVEKPLTEFRPRKSRAKKRQPSGGLTLPECIECHRAAARARRSAYLATPEGMLANRMNASLRRKRYASKIDWNVREAVKRSGSSPKAEALLGYSMAELRAHLERQFTKGMSWAAFDDGRIHIDHIVPVSSFDLTDPEQVKAAWAITNLRPLWAKDNLAKSSRIESLL